MKQIHGRNRRALARFDRTDWLDRSRHPLTIVSWATKAPNVGSINRLCEAYLVGHLYALDQPAKSTAVGTARWQPRTVTWSLNDAVAQAKADGYTVVALEQTDESIVMEDAVMPERMCLLIGNEGSGLPQSALDMADMAVEIRQFGLVGSLNVATATAIALYEWARQNQGVDRLHEAMALSA